MRRLSTRDSTASAGLINSRERQLPGPSAASVPPREDNRGYRGGDSYRGNGYRGGDSDRGSGSYGNGSYRGEVDPIAAAHMAAVAAVHPITADRTTVVPTTAVCGSYGNDGSSHYGNGLAPATAMAVVRTDSGGGSHYSNGGSSATATVVAARTSRQRRWLPLRQRRWIPTVAALTTAMAATGITAVDPASGSHGGPSNNGGGSHYGGGGSSHNGGGSYNSRSHGGSGSSGSSSQWWWISL